MEWKLLKKSGSFFFLRPRVKRGPAWLVHCNNNPVAEAKLFMSPRGSPKDLTKKCV